MMELWQGEATSQEARPARPNHPHRHNQGLILLVWPSNQCEYISSDLSHLIKHMKTNHKEDQSIADPISPDSTKVNANIVTKGRHQ